MLIHPLNSETFVTNIDEKSIQPNAVDIRIDKLFSCHGFAVLTDEETIHRKIIEENAMSPKKWIAEYLDKKIFTLQPRTYYQFETIHEIGVAAGEAAWIVHRSSLARNGVFITSGIYDSGFKGRLGGVIYNSSDGIMFIEKNARIGQLIIARSKTVGSYEGQYQNTGVIQSDV